MRTILSLLLSAVIPSLRDGASLQLKLNALRHQLLVLERQRTTQSRLTRIDRFFWVWLYRLWPGCLDVVVMVKPDTVILASGCRNTGRIGPPRSGLRHSDAHRGIA